MKYLFIAEKPSVMREVQKVYRNYQTEIEKAIGGSIVFTALAGHVCGYANPKEYDGWDVKWKDLPLPMMPKEWKIIFPNSRNKKLYQEVVSLYKEKGCNGIIVGTDSDVEGNGIYYLVMQKAGWQNIPTLRFFYNDLTESALKKSLLSMTDFFRNPRDVHMTESYLLRSQFDWQMGMNMTVAATRRTGTLLKIGRVKAPTLKLIYDNHMAIENFVPQTVYQIMDDYQDGFSGLMVDKQGKPYEYKTKEEANQILDSITEKEGTVLKAERKEQKTYAPKLFKLSKLQVEAGNQFGYSPSDVLSIAQSLYEKHKVLSYPRTDGDVISVEKAQEIPSILHILSDIPDFSHYIENIPSDATHKILSMKNYVNDEAVAKASHDALMPTIKKPDLSAMTDKEKNIYTLIVKRLISILYPPLVEAKTVMYVKVGNFLFKSNGTTVVDKGWTSVVPKKSDSKDIPLYQKGDVLSIDKIYIHDKTSKPPKRLTEQALIGAMENIASSLSDQDYKNVMKESRGIGTPATRGAIIDELRQMNYFSVKKKSIYLTIEGKNYIESLKNFSIINPEMTADMELHMKHVREGSENYQDVKQLLDNQVIQMTKDALEIPMIRETAYQCPVCGKTLIREGMRLKCTEDDFYIPLRVAGISLTEEMLRSLFQEGRTGMIQGFKKKDGTKFNACLVLDNNQLKFSASPYVCPICKKPMRDVKWGLSCSGYFDKSCDFSVGYEQFGKKLTVKQIEALLTKGKTGNIKGMKKRNGEEMEGSLYIDEETHKIRIHFKKKKS